MSPLPQNLDRYDQSWYDRGRAGWYVLLWWLIQETLFRWIPHPFDELRCKLLRLFGARVGKCVKVRPTAKFTYPWFVTLEDFSWIGDEVILYSLAAITVGPHCVISQKSYLCTGSHDLSDPSFGLIVKPIQLEAACWVAADCFIAPGVTLGSGCVVGARSSVFKSLPAGMVCLGNPCRPVYPRPTQP